MPFATESGAELERLDSLKYGGKCVVVTGEFVRPADTTAYAAGDVVSNSTGATVLILFPATPSAQAQGCASQNGGSGYITKARLSTSKKDETAQYRLYLYTVNEATASVVADNVADTRIYADRLVVVGYIDFPACSSAAGTGSNTAADTQTTDVRLPFKCAPDTRALYGKLVNITGTTPASAQTFSISLTVDQN